MSNFKLESQDFDSNGNIPQKFTCDGKSISPELEWSGAPEGTKSFAVIVDDPDALNGTYVHWVLYNIPADQHKLSEDIGPFAELASPLEQGVNGSDKLGYVGPCPPKGDKAHKYKFTIYALDTDNLNTRQGKVTKEYLLKSMEGHILATAELTGLYQRQ